MALSPHDFTTYYVATLKRAAPTLEVEIIQDLELKVSENDSENRFQTFLDNAYTSYLNDQDARDEIIDQFVASQVETFEMHKRPNIDTRRIVPIIKDRQWMEAVTETMAGNTAEFPVPLNQEYNSELQIFFAEDSDHNIRYLNQDNLKSIPYRQDELLNLSCDNLNRLLDGSIEIAGSEGTYMMTAGGNYETSLLLFSPLWRGHLLDVKGELVISIPTRDILLITGSEDQQGIERIREVSHQAMEETAYTVTSVLFEWSDNKFEVFEG